jgi:transmembrane sensor
MTTGGTRSDAPQPAFRPAAPDEIARQAAEWIVQLTADDPAERRRAETAFERWKRRDPRHAEAATRMEGFLGQIHGLREGADAGPARTAIARAYRSVDRRRRVRRALGAAAVALLLALPGWAVLDRFPPAVLLADVATTTGEWETRTLADGSRLILNGASAVNLRFDEERRVLELVQGEIEVEVAADARRPFLVETADGDIRALGTRFVVRRDRTTLLTMLESRVLVQTAAERRKAGHEIGGHEAGGSSADGTVIGAGQRVRIAPDRLGPIETIDPKAVADAWRSRQLVVQGSPLPDVLDELARHRPGLIHFDRAALAGIRVSAVLPLDDTDRALRLLADSFPALRMRSLTRYLVMVDRP